MRSKLNGLRVGYYIQGKEEYSQPFEAYYYDEMRQSWETQVFRYVTMDELYTNLEMGESIVYKLTDVAQEMIFMSREMAEEFSITIEQLYSIQLIKNGNFQKSYTKPRSPHFTGKPLNGKRIFLSKGND